MKNIKYKFKILMIIIFTLVGMLAGYNIGNFISSHWYNDLGQPNQDFYEMIKIFFNLASTLLFGIACLFIFKDDIKSKN